MSDSTSKLTSSIADMFPDPIAILNTKGTILWCNAATFEMSQLAPEEILGERFTKLTSLRSKDVPKYVKLFASILTGKKLDPIQVRWFRKDGTFIDSEARVSLIKLPDGKRAIQVITRNISDLRAAELMARKEQELAQQYLDVAGVTLIALDNTGKIIMMNNFGKEMLGVQNDEVLGKYWIEEFIPLESRESVKEEFHKVLIDDSFSFHSYENLIQTKEGSMRLIRWTNTPLKNEDGKIVGALSSGEDITEVKEKEKRLIESERTFRNLFEQAAVGVARVGQNGFIIEANNKLEQMLGYDEDELVGIDVFEITTREDLEIEKVFSAELIAGKRNNYSMEKRFFKKDGSQIWGRLTVSSSRDEFGNINFTIGIVEEITEYRKLQEELLVSEERYRSIVEKAGVGITLVDIDDHILEANPKYLDLLGYSLEELKLMTIADFTHPEDAEKDHMLFREILDRKRDSYQMKKRYIRKDGEQIWVNLTVTGVRNRKSEVISVIGIIEDITVRKITEEALLASEQRFRDIIEHSSEMHYIKDDDARPYYISPHVKDILGYEPEEIYKCWSSLMITGTKINGKAFDSIYLALSTGKKQDPYLMELKAKDDSIHLFQVTESPQKDTSGNVNGLVGSMRDITETTRIQEALEVSAQRYRELIENLPAGVSISSSGKFNIVNPAMCKLLGYEEDELVGMRVQDTIAIKDRAKNLAETELRRTGKSSVYEMQIIRKDGTTRDVQVSAVPRRNDLGEIIGTIGLITDISEIKSVQHELVASETRLKRLIEQLPLGLVITDLSSQIELVNQAFSNAVSQEKTKLIGTSLANYMDSDQLEKIKNEREGIKLGTGFTTEIDVMRTDDVRRNFRIVAAPNIDVAGDVIGIVGIFEDITDQKRYEAIRLQQEKEIELYGSLFRHDMTNDLGLVLSYIEAVQMLMESPSEEVRSFLNSALATIERTSGLLKNFGHPQEVRETDIIDFITEIAVEAQEAEKGLQISVMYVHGARDIRITAGGLLSLVFMNLFRNAAQHAGESPVVQVEVSQNENQIGIIVSDNGPGVLEEFQETLFKRGVSSKGEVGGLGLYLCKQIIEMSGGSIELQKEKKGATFSLTLPVK